MIKSAHTVIVRFSPIKKNSEAFSDKILEIEGATISGGSYASYPSITVFREDWERAKKVESAIINIIEEHGGKVIND